MSGLQPPSNTPVQGADSGASDASDASDAVNRVQLTAFRAVSINDDRDFLRDIENLTQSIDTLRTMTSQKLSELQDILRMMPSEVDKPLWKAAMKKIFEEFIDLYVNWVDDLGTYCQGVLALPSTRRLKAQLLRKTASIREMYSTME